MAVSNGQPGNATTFNDAFLSRTVDSDTTAKIDLLNADSASGASIINVQRELNKLNSYLGSTPNTAEDALPVWSNNQVGASTDPVVLRADLLTERFDGGTGHSHTGVDGEGPQVSAEDLSNFNKYFAEFQTDVFSAADGLSDDVTTVFSLLTPGGGVAAVGVPTTAPYNIVELRTDPSGDQIEEPGGRKVYGRVTESSGTWTLTYYYEDSSGVETAYSLPTQDIRLYWREVFSAATRPTFPTDTGFIGSLDATADIVDATASVPGRVSIGSQTLGGVKTFQDGVIVKALSLVKNDVASGGTVTALTNAFSYIKLTGASTTELQGISADTIAKRVLIYNDSTGDLTLKNENAGASAANRILTPDGNDLVVSENESVELIYDLTAGRWVVISTAGAGGSGAGVGYQESLGTGDGVTTSFGPLSFVPSSTESIIVLLDGVVEPIANWSYPTTDVVFSTAPALGQSVYVWYLTGGTPIVVGPTGTQEVEYRTLSGGEAAAKQLTLSATPLSASKVMVDLIGGSAQEYSVDYTVSGSVLDWNGLGLDGVLSTGDKLRINYLS